MTKFLNISVDNTLGGSSPSDVAVSSQKAVKEYVDAHSGGGGSTAVDNLSITRNSSLQIQTVGVIDSNNTTNAIKTWTGTKAQYNAIASKDTNTEYLCTNTGEIYLGDTPLANNSERIPTGTILPYGGSTAPSGFLLCNGGAISRTTYARLFSVIGTTYGAGDGSTTFNLPNLIGLTSDNVPCKGNRIVLGLTDGTSNYGSFAYEHKYYGKIQQYGGNIGVVVSGTNYMGANKGIGLTTDASKSGVVSSLSSASQKTLAIIKY